MSQEYFSYLKTPIGELKISADENSICSIQFLSNYDEIEKENDNKILQICKKQLKEYFAGTRKEFDFKFLPNGTEFQKKVWKELEKIPYGKTVSYGYIAERVGGKNMMRAVGGANSKNNIPIVVPCHRVIGADGSLTGYAGGIWRKEWLLKHEKKYLQISDTRFETQDLR